MVFEAYTPEDLDYAESHPQKLGESTMDYNFRIKNRRGNYRGGFQSALGDIGTYVATELMGAKKGYDNKVSQKVIVNIGKGEIKRKKKHQMKKTTRALPIDIPRSGVGMRQSRNIVGMSSIVGEPLRYSNQLQRTAIGYQGYGLDPNSQYNLATILNKQQEINTKLDKASGSVISQPIAPIANPLRSVEEQAVPKVSSIVSQGRLEELLKELKKTREPFTEEKELPKMSYTGLPPEVFPKEMMMASQQRKQISPPEEELEPLAYRLGMPVQQVKRAIEEGIPLPATTQEEFEKQYPRGEMPEYVKILAEMAKEKPSEELQIPSARAQPGFKPTSNEIGMMAFGLGVPVSTVKRQLETFSYTPEELWNKLEESRITRPLSKKERAHLKALQKQAAMTPEELIISENKMYSMA